MTQEKIRRTLEVFMTEMTVLVNPALLIFAKEKSRLRRMGVPIDNFDLLIGVTAIHHDLILVTNNTRHFQRLQGIKLEDRAK